MAWEDDDPIARLAEASALSETPPLAPDGSPIEPAADPRALASFEALRSWDIWFADALRARRRPHDTVILAFVPRPPRLLLRSHRAAHWSGSYQGIAARAAERAGDGATMTVEFANFALDVAVRKGRLALTVFSTAFDVAGVMLSVRGADGCAFSRGETDMLGRLELAVPDDNDFELVLEPPLRAPA